MFGWGHVPIMVAPQQTAAAVEEHVEVIQLITNRASAPSLGDFLAELHNSEVLSDIIICSEDGQAIKCHKLVLIRWSAPLRRMLCGGGWQRLASAAGSLAHMRFCGTSETSTVALVVPDDGCVRCSKQLPACRLRQRALQIPALFGCPERRKGSIAWNTVKVPLMWGPPCKTASAAAPLTTLWLLWILSLLSSSLLSRGPHPRLYFQRSVNALWGHQPVKALWGLH